MTEQAYWTSLWVDSIDRSDWQERAREAIDLDGVEEIQIDAKSGEVRVRYNPAVIKPILLHTHLRAAGL